MNTPKQPFIDPYHEQYLVPPDSMKKTSIRTSSKAHSDIQSAHGRSGTFQITLNVLTKKLIETLNHHGLTEYNPDAYEYAINNCRIVFPDLAAFGLVGSTANVAPAQDVHTPSQAVSGDDGCGASGLARGIEKERPDSGDTGRKPAGGQRKGNRTSNGKSVTAKD